MFKASRSFMGDSRLPKQLLHCEYFLRSWVPNKQSEIQQQKPLLFKQWKIFKIRLGIQVFFKQTLRHLVCRRMM